MTNHGTKTTTIQKTSIQLLLAGLSIFAIPAWGGAFVQLDDTPHRGDGSFFGFILLVIFLWGLFNSKESRKFLIFIPLSYGVPFAMVLAWMLTNSLPTDYSIKQWFAVIALGWIGYWIAFFVRGFLRNGEATPVPVSPQQQPAAPEVVQKLSPSPGMGVKQSNNQSNDPVKKTGHSDDANKEKIKPSPNPSAPGAKRPKSASEPQPTTSTKRKFDREKALRAIYDNDAQRPSLSEIEHAPEAKPDSGPKPFSYTAGSYTRTAKEANTERLRVVEITFTNAAGDSQGFEPSTADLKKLESNIFDCKPDTMIKDAPCEKTMRIDLVAIVNAGESLRIRICADGLFHENIHGWVHRAFQDEDYCYWRRRLCELEDQISGGD